MSKLRELLKEAYDALVDEEDLDIDTARGCVAHARAIIEDEGGVFEVDEAVEDKIALIHAVVNQLLEDIDNLDMTALSELLMFIPCSLLTGFLKKYRPDDQNDTTH
jgi:hypothetical protein